MTTQAVEKTTPYVTLLEVQCGNCGRRYWRTPLQVEQACAVCRGACAPDKHHPRRQLSAPPVGREGKHPGRLGNPSLTRAIDYDEIYRLGV